MGWKDGVARLRVFAAAPWFPILVGLLSGVNMFTLVMSGPLVILYCSSVLAAPKRWFLTAVANAVGTVAGCFVMVLFMETKGTEFIKAEFPSTFQSKWWTWTEQQMHSYGHLATVPVAAMPIILHPLIFFGKLSNMSDTALLTAILLGRIIKYSIMAQMALTAPRMLRFFGATDAVIQTVEKTKKH
eukprot:TRINITY_DN34492_c0_g1_i1.p1 TRINITY_DN34492_c0_g1~~TRINITY_DN34492_c0_g1_i1.p1  ORF type:complete len:186 (-),score=28.52 TRINITY_DN34492_c0_g1_i1:120-677(-)